MIGSHTLTGRIYTPNTRTHGHIYVHTYARGLPLFSARPFICRKTLWCISFDAVCALVMQIPRRPAGRPALAARIFRDTDQYLSDRSRGMEIPHRQGRVNFDMYGPQPLGELHRRHA